MKLNNYVDIYVMNQPYVNELLITCTISPLKTVNEDDFEKFWVEKRKKNRNILILNCSTKLI